MFLQEKECLRKVNVAFSHQGVVLAQKVMKGEPSAYSYTALLCQVVDSIRVFKTKVNVIKLSNASMQPSCISCKV